MMKKFLAISFILILLFTSGMIYLNRVFLPVKTKGLIISAIQQETGKKTTLGSLQLNIFKGLVLRDLGIWDGSAPLLKVAEANCTFLFWPFFKKQLIIPSLHIKSAVIYLNRRADNSFNLADILAPKSRLASVATSQFNLVVSKVIISSSRIEFKDDTFSPAFTCSMEDANLALFLSLPASARFNFKSVVPSLNSSVRITGSGEYKIPDKELFCKVNIKHIVPSQFSAYYQKTGLSVMDGTADASVDISMAQEVLRVDVFASLKSLALKKDKLSARIDSGLEVRTKYDLVDKKLKYYGNANILNLDASGVDFLNTIQGLAGAIRFDESSVSADKINANILGIRVESKFKVTNFTNPVLELTLTAPVDLSSALKLAKDKFNLSLAVDLEGQGNVFLNVLSEMKPNPAPQINGYLDITGATAKIGQMPEPLSNIKGKVDFDSRQLKWQGVVFQTLSRNWQTSGTLTNFQSPGVDIELSSDDIFLHSLFTVNNKLLRVSQLSGKYFSSDLSFSGDFDLTDPANILADARGTLGIELADLKKMPFPKLKDQLALINPSGKVTADISFSGKLKDIKSSVIQVNADIPIIGLYGLKASSGVLEYLQSDGIGDITKVQLELYGGILNANAKINLKSDNLPYWVNAEASDIKLEQLKLDTAAKGGDLAGTIQGQVKANGFSNDLSRLNGSGQLIITDGKLWQLNLFKGLGTLLFTKDFTNIVFSEGYCGFIILDKAVSTDNLKLRGNFADISGSARIGFDSSIDATLNVQVADDVPLTGTFKDVTTAILGQAGKVGVIKILGTLKEPKFQYKQAVVDIIKGLKDVIFGK